MTNRQADVVGSVRPNIQITHQLNGRVKDYAAANDLELAEAYREIIETGLAELEASDADNQQ
jgi:hypothetical protein